MFIVRNRFFPRRQGRKAFTGTVFPSEKRLRDMIVDEVLGFFDEEIHVSNVQDERFS
jgi:hypothetical protein